MTNSNPDPAPIILHTTSNDAVRVEVMIRNETVWLSQKALTELFGVKVPVIAKHLANIYASKELNETTTVSILETVRQEGSRKVQRQIEIYNLDASITAPT